MLKDALLKKEEVRDSEGIIFTVLASIADEAVLQLSDEHDKDEEDLFQYYLVTRRPTDGVWVFRDAPEVYLEEIV
jgi:hypothetical protein